MHRECHKSHHANPNPGPAQPCMFDGARKSAAGPLQSTHDQSPLSPTPNTSHISCNWDTQVAPPASPEVAMGAAPPLNPGQFVDGSAPHSS